MKFQPIRRQQARWQTQHGVIALVEQTLVGQVVHGEDGRHGGHRVGRHVSAGHGRMPVMHVQHVGAPVGIQLTRGQVGRHPAEQGEALQVVGPLAAVGRQIGVAAALVQIRGINHINRHTGHGHIAQPEGDFGRAKQGTDIAHQHLPLDPLLDGGQPRQDQANIDPSRCQGLWQRPQHVRKSTRFNQGENFSRRMQHSHEAILASMSPVTSVMPLALR